VRKGQLQEIFSKALYADDPKLYSVGYRDFDEIIEVPLLEFIQLSENFSVIPPNRVVFIKKDDEILYRKHGFTIL
jgi:hypothetical protein